MDDMAKCGHEAAVGQIEREQETKGGGYYHVFVLNQHWGFHFKGALMPAE
jgi:hypothetical protein